MVIQEGVGAGNVFAFSASLVTRSVGNRKRASATSVYTPGDFVMRFVLIRSLFVGAAVVATPLCADEAAVKKMVSDYADAFNNQNLESVTSYWTPNGLHIDRETGERTEGRDAIAADIRDSFDSSPDSRIQGRIDDLRFIRPDVASVEGRVITSSPGVAPTESDFSAILVSADGKWMIERIEERPVPVPSTSYVALRELDWLVGTWKDESNTMRIDNVYIDGQQVATADQFAQSAAALATVPPPASEEEAAQVEWMPLGTFAVAKDPKDVDPTNLIQLAVSQEGIISGTMYNTKTDEAYTVQGQVDKDTQRVAFGVGESDSIVIESGLYNLTQDDAPVLVHFGPDKTENWLFVRLEDQSGDTAEG